MAKDMKYDIMASAETEDWFSTENFEIGKMRLPMPKKVLLHMMVAMEYLRRNGVDYRAIKKAMIAELKK